MYLGIDLGTSAAKVCVIGEAGDAIVTAAAPLGMTHPFPGACEQDPRDWWHAVCAAIHAVPQEIRRTVRAIGLSGQMHGAVLLDAYHRVLRPAILWNDGRAENECARIVEADPEAGALSGAFPMPGFTAPKLFWLSQHEPECHARIAHVLLPKDYIGLSLHGACVTDPSDAAGTGWLDQAAVAWSHRLCEISATDPSWLPPIHPGCDIVGTLRAESAETLGLVKGIPVVAGAGDAAAGAVGIGAVEDGDGFISLGTSGQLFVTTGAYRPNVENRLHA